MTAVLKLVTAKNDETVASLEYLLNEARRGQVVGIAACFLIAGGQEDALIAGAYSRPADAVNAAMRLSWKLTKLQDAEH